MASTISLLCVLLTVVCMATSTPVDTSPKVAAGIEPAVASESEAKTDLKTSETLGLGLLGFPTPLYYGSYGSYYKPYRYYSYAPYRRYGYGYGYGYPYYSYHSYYDWPYHYF